MKRSILLVLLVAYVSLAFGNSTDSLFLEITAQVEAFPEDGNGNPVILHKGEIFAEAGDDPAGKIIRYGDRSLRLPFRNKQKAVSYDKLYEKNAEAYKLLLDDFRWFIKTFGGSEKLEMIRQANEEDFFVDVGALKQEIGRDKTVLLANRLDKEALTLQKQSEGTIKINTAGDYFRLIVPSYPSIVYSPSDIQKIKAKGPAPPDEKIKDDDLDGVPDHIDECPGEKGTTALKGCPDQDGDGISDAKDKCPEVKGLLENEGCPKDKSSIWPFLLAFLALLGLGAYAYWRRGRKEAIPGMFEYNFTNGESLTSISRKFGFSVDDIIAGNSVLGIVSSKQQSDPGFLEKFRTMQTFLYIPGKPGSEKHGSSGNDPFDSKTKKETTMAEKHHHKKGSESSSSAEMPAFEEFNKLINKLDQQENRTIELTEKVERLASSTQNILEQIKTQQSGDKSHDRFQAIIEKLEKENLKLKSATETPEIPKPPAGMLYWEGHSSFTNWEQFLNEIRKIEDEVIAFVHRVQNRAPESPEAHWLTVFMSKFLEKKPGESMGKWENDFRTMEENNGLVLAKEAKKRLKSGTPEQQMQAMNKLFFDQVLNPYLSALLIFIEETRKLGGFIGSPTELGQEAASFDTQFSNLYNQTVNKGIHPMKVELFEKTFDIKGEFKMAGVDELSPAYRKLKNKAPKQTVLEILSYGFKYKDIFNQESRIIEA